MKYQFCIRFENTTVNSAATKAVLDCNKLFLDKGYTDYTLTVWDNSNKLKYYLKLISELVRFFSALKKGSIVGIQYPLLSINSIFKHFIKLGRLKGVKFFCVIHDLEALRIGGKDQALIDKEIDNLNYFDTVIAHNPQMMAWLQQKGLKTRAISLELFDYLYEENLPEKKAGFDKTIVFAGNLSKSVFIYALNEINTWSFNLYGPFFNAEKARDLSNVKWRGEYSPTEIVGNLDGSFGLIWDGECIDKCDEVLGNYLRYNNPHKFSLYLAAGLPVIAPADSAIGAFIKKHNIGYLINDLFDLEEINPDEETYKSMKANVAAIQAKVINGDYFLTAINTIEKQIINTI